MAWGSWSWSLFFPKFSTHSAHPAALPRSWTVTCHLEWSLICLHSFWKFALYLRNMLSRDLMPKVLRVLVPNHLDQWRCLSLSLSLSVPPGQFNFSSLPPRQTVYLLICVLASPRPSCSSVYKWIAVLLVTLFRRTSGFSGSCFCFLSFFFG